MMAVVITNEYIIFIIINFWGDKFQENTVRAHVPILRSYPYNIFVLMKKMDGQTDRNTSNKIQNYKWIYYFYYY